MKNEYAYQIVPPFDLPFSREIWESKYRYKEKDHTVKDTHLRQIVTLFPNIGNKDIPSKISILEQGRFIAGGRIIAGVGTEKVVTLMNCYVNTKMEDSISGTHGIAEALNNIIYTQQQGGGIGTDFSTLRPRWARLKRTGAGSFASGVLPFIDMWCAACATIMSAGGRRGAMMSTLSDTHPDLPEFITAKKQKGRWEQTNISVLISDAFMAAVEDDAVWHLYFHEPHYEKDLPTFEDEAGVTQYIYSTWNARDLWKLITETTYDYSEPGVIFIDRVNELNNLSYLEDIRCTNPCGEQPLPPHGCCNLGAVNLAQHVRYPFTKYAEIDWNALERTARFGVRYLDSVIDNTRYPLKEQEYEETHKRRIGLGITGLANCLAFLGNRYGAGSTHIVRQLMKFIAVRAYEESIQLAKEKGAFPLFNLDKHTTRPFMQKMLGHMSEKAVSDYYTHGIRNGVILTIAPTGTTSIYCGNISSGLEPTFALEYMRKVRQPDGSWKEVKAEDYAVKVWRTLYPDTKLPEYMNVAADLTVLDHIEIQAACQEWVDASVSKTINIRPEMSIEDFRYVYDLAYQLGCKGCTTYRPSDVRGSILSTSSTTPAESKDNQQPKEQAPVLRPRGAVVVGSTYKLNWPSWKSSIYLTINVDAKNQPIEVFMHSKDSRHQEWQNALTVMISALLRLNADLDFIGSELEQMQSPTDSGWIDGKYYGSVVARIGTCLREHGKSLRAAPSDPGENSESNASRNSKGFKQPCPQCGAPNAIISSEGCEKCICGLYSKC